MRFLPAMLVSLLCASASIAQQAPLTNFNLDFETPADPKKLPQPWIEWGKGYVLSVDTTEKFKGKAALRIQAPAVMDNIQFGSAANPVPVTFGGKEVELRGYLKFSGVTKGWVGLMMRIDSKSGILQLDNGQSKGIHGTEDWKQYSIKMQLPANADKIYLGAILVGPGAVWVDELELLVDGKPFTQAPPKKIFPAAVDKVVVIVNENTVSQSEYTTMAFSAAPNVTVIGSTTAGADGNVSPIVLPGGLRTGISGIGVYYPDGRQTQQIGIVPQVEVKPTILGIAEGRDEPLEKALQLINGK
jgi:hypothetical protein